jgi:putative DNA primase/helicase
MDNNAQTITRPALLSGPLDGQFLRLRPDKAPINWTRYDIKAAATFECVGVLMPEPYVVVDIDDAEEAQRLTNLIQSEKIKCQIMQTARGRHFWFVAESPMKNSIKSMTAIGLHADYRSYGKQSQVCIKLMGKRREWLTNYDWDDLDLLPRWLRPLRQTKYNFLDMSDGDGRNQTLYDYQCMLSAHGFTKEEGFQTIRYINQYVFKDPLSKKEINTICRDEAYPEETPLPEEVDPDAPWFGEKGKFLHNIMGDALVKEMPLVSVHDQLYTYKNGFYQPGENALLRSIINKFPAVKRTQESEVLNYLNIQKHIDTVPVDEYIINCLNGRLNLKTGEMLPHTPESLDFQQINATYDKTAYCESLDHMLMRVFCGDYQLYKLFEEMLGYCLIKNCRMQKIFIFFGEGNNGKSTLLRVITSFIGHGNYTTLSLQDLEKTFRPAELENKLVNLGDDIPATTIKDSSLLKSISSGENVLVERKNKDPFILRNYATLIYTTNKMPHVNDKSFGFYRRLILVPLDAKFDVTDEDYDPDIAQKVVTEDARSYLLNMAIRGLHRMLKNGFTKSDRVQKAIETYKTKSSTALSWISENEIDEKYLLSKPTGELYFEFKSWCENEGIDNIPKQRSFSDDVTRQFNFVTSKPQRDKNSKKVCKFYLKN